MVKVENKKPVLAKRRSERIRGKEDRLSNLPDSLIGKILSYLPIHDVVKTSALSTRWRTLWKYVPGLNLDYAYFSEYITLMHIVDTILDARLGSSELCLESFKLNIGCDVNDDEDYKPDQYDIWRWIKIIIGRKVKHIDVRKDSSYGPWELKMPQVIYICKSLVSLKLVGIILPSPEIVSLPLLKVMELRILEFGNNLLALETLISKCPVLESLIIEREFNDNVKVLRVCSKSLVRFTHDAYDDDDYFNEAQEVVIDAPKLEILRINDYRTSNFVLNIPTSLVKVDIDTMFHLSFEKQFDPNDLPKRDMIRNFLLGISSVKDMVISSSTLQVFYDYSQYEQLPIFHNLSFFRIKSVGYSLGMLSILLERCPKLKSLVVGSTEFVDREGLNIRSGPWCFLSSLEYVEIERPLKGEAREMKAVSYLLENTTILKKLVVYLDDSVMNKGSVILKELRSMPTCSSSCRVVVL